MKAVCSIDNCDTPVLARGFCGLHYNRWRIHGDPNRQPITTTTIERLMGARVLVPGPLPSPCWIRPGVALHRGYGRVSVNNQSAFAHRFSYEHFVGPIPDGLHIDHLCRTPACFNPAHLEPVTPQENSRRGFSPAAIAVRLNACLNGHSFDDAYVDRSGKRHCRACCRARDARRRPRHRSAAAKGSAA